jgi:acetyltransferase
MVAQRLRACTGATPVLACWLWEAATPACFSALRDAGILAFHSPEAAVRTFGYLWQHTENLRFLAEVREALHDAEEEVIDPGRATAALASACRAGRAVLTRTEVAELFAAYGLPTLQRRWVDDADGAVAAAADLGYPVLLELAPPEGGPPSAEGARLQAGGPSAVRQAVRSLQLLAREHFEMAAPRLAVLPVVPPTAVEVAVRSMAHRDLGPFLTLGQGSAFGSAPGGAVQARAPLTPLTAREMIEHGPLAAGIATQPGQPPLELDGLERFLLRLSRLAVEQSAVREAHVQGLLLWGRHVLAREARVVLHEGPVGQARSPSGESREK